MTHRSQKKSLLAIAAILLLAGTYIFLQLNPRIMQAVSNLGPTKCMIGNWESFDMPALAAEWKGKLESIGIQATDITAQGTGEKSECTHYTLLGTTQESRPASSAANTSVSATIQVDNISDDTALGEIIIKILTAIKPSKKYDQLYQANIRLTFMDSERKNIEFYPDWADHWLKQGLTSAQLIQTFDRRYIPPTVTPPPTKK